MKPKFFALLGFSIILAVGCPAAIMGASDGQATSTPLNFTNAKATYDSFKFLDAATAFQAIVTDPNSPDRAQAAPYLLRSYRRGRKHDLLMANYDACIEASSGTLYQAECQYELALSIYKNTHNPSAAYDLFGKVADSNPSSLFAASGAVYQRSRFPCMQ